jgi:hypothetical protein
MTNYGPAEHVYVEREWYDGPRAGIADVNGVAHRFDSLFDEKDDEYLGTFRIWPIETAMLELEIEQWRIFVEWNALYEAGKVATDSHPAHGGRSARWDEIEILLKQSRTTVPSGALNAVAELINIEGQARYAPSGPAYMFKWRVL